MIDATECETCLALLLLLLLLHGFASLRQPAGRARQLSATRPSTYASHGPSPSTQRSSVGGGSRRGMRREGGGGGLGDSETYPLLLPTSPSPPTPSSHQSQTKLITPGLGKVTSTNRMSHGGGLQLSSKVVGSKTWAYTPFPVGLPPHHLLIQSKPDHADHTWTR